MWTLQRIYDGVSGHLMRQYQKAVHEEEGKPLKLMYITPAGLKDPIGCLIPDGMYDPAMEGYAFKGVATWSQWSNDDGLNKLRNALMARGIDVDDDDSMRLLTDLQRVHDNHEPEFWFDRLVATGRAWRLSRSGLEVYASNYGRR